MRKLISVVAPAFNEEECVDELALRLSRIAEGLNDRYDFEFVIIENGSVDATFAKLMAIREHDPRFRVLRLSRNFGIEGALTAGLRAIRGDAAVIMCADLQDPPEMIPEFVKQWEAGYQNVYGLIRSRSDEGPLRQFLTKAFYVLLNRLSEHPVPRSVSDFRLVDRDLYETLNRFEERNRMLRSMWGWLGWKSVGVPFDRPPRFGGRSTYRLLGNIIFALRGLMSSTSTPLRIIPTVGVGLSVLSIIVLAGLVVRWVVRGVPFRGFGTIVALVLLLFSLNFLVLGILSEYIGLIFEQVRGRPLYIEAARYGFDNGAEAAIPEAVVLASSS